MASGALGANFAGPDVPHGVVTRIKTRYVVVRSLSGV
jgi:hypothetical protein